MPKRLFITGLVIALSFLSLGRPPALAQTSTVGVILPLTGPLASIGEAAKDGIQMASQEFDPPGKVEFAFEDYAFDSAKAATMAKKLAEIDKVAALVVFGSGGAQVCAGIAERTKVPLIAMAMDRNYVKNKKYIFNYYLGAGPLTDAAVVEVKKRGYQHIAIVTTEQEGMLALRDRFREALGENVVSDDTFSPAERDFQSTAAKIKSLNPDAVYLLLLPPQASIFARQLRAINFRPALFGSHPMDNPGEIMAAQGALDDAWLVTSATTKAAKFLQGYRAIYGKRPEHSAPFGYDIAKLLIEANKSGQPIEEYLSNLNAIEGVMGTSRSPEPHAWEGPVEATTVKEIIGNAEQAKPKR